MKVLAIDTSSNVATVAIVEDNKIFSEFSINHKKTHSQKLMPLISKMLEVLDLKLDDIDLFAVAEGPGSFTGIRIGIAAIKGMAYALNKKVIGVSTLDALAYNIDNRNALICPIIDARNNQVFTCIYEYKNAKLGKIIEYSAIHISDLMIEIKKHNKRIVFLGDGLEIHKEYLIQELNELAIFPKLNYCYPRASSVALCAIELYNEGKSSDCFKIEAFYLRKSQAEQVKDLEELKNG